MGEFDRKFWDSDLVRSLGPIERLVYICLLSTGEAPYSPEYVQQVARWTGIHERQVYRVIRHFESLGVLAWCHE